MNTKVCVFLFLAFVPLDLVCYSADDSWTGLTQFSPGQPIRIVLNDAKSYCGRFQSLSDADIVVRLSAGDQMFERRRVLRVSTPAKSHRARNSLIGVATGFGAGAIVGVASPELGQGKCAQGSCVNAESVAIAGLVGGAVGAVAGAVIPTGGWRDLYRARQ